MAAELFNANLATTTVASGGTDAPSSGTVETWNVASSSMFGAAATGISQFHVADAASGKGTEIIAVTNVSGTTWTVTRGAESTTPVTHVEGFTVYQVVTTGFLGTLPSSSSPLTLAGGGTGLSAASGAALLAGLGAAPLVSPALTGTPTAPTATAGDASTQIATDAFVAEANAYFLRIFAV